MQSTATETNKSLEEVLITDVLTIPEDRLLTELFDVVSTATIPVAVVDEENRLQGIIIRGALIGALAGNNQFINENGIVDSVDEVTSEVETNG